MKNKWMKFLKKCSLARASAVEDPLSFKAWRSRQNGARGGLDLEPIAKDRVLLVMILTRLGKQSVWQGVARQEGDEIQWGAYLARLLVPPVGLAIGMAIVHCFGG